MPRLLATPEDIEAIKAGIMDIKAQIIQNAPAELSLASYDLASLDKLKSAKAPKLDGAVSVPEE